MKTPKVRLYIRVGQRHGHYAFLKPVWNRNHSLRASYALVAGEAEYHLKGVTIFASFETVSVYGSLSAPMRTWPSFL